MWLNRRRHSAPDGETSAVADRLSVLFADDSPGDRQQYGDLIRADPRLELTIVDHPDEVQRAVEVGPVAVAVLDYDFSYWGAVSMTGLDLAQSLRQRSKKLGLILLTRYPSTHLIHEFMEAASGAGRGFLSKGEDDKNNLCAHIHHVAMGGVVVSAAWRERYENFQKFIKFKSPRLHVLKLLKQGYEYRSIVKLLKDQGIVDIEPGQRTVTEWVSEMADKLEILEKDEYDNGKDRTRVLIDLYDEAEVDPYYLVKKGR